MGLSYYRLCILEPNQSQIKKNELHSSEKAKALIENLKLRYEYIRDVNALKQSNKTTNIDTCNADPDFLTVMAFDSGYLIKSEDFVLENTYNPKKLLSAFPESKILCIWNFDYDAISASYCENGELLRTISINEFDMLSEEGNVLPQEFEILNTENIPFENDYTSDLPLVMAGKSYPEISTYSYVAKFIDKMSMEFLELESPEDDEVYCLSFSLFKKKKWYQLF